MEKITMRGIRTKDEYGEKCWFLPNGRKTYSYKEAKKALDEYNKSHGYIERPIFTKRLKELWMNIINLISYGKTEKM